MNNKVNSEQDVLQVLKVRHARLGAAIAALETSDIAFGKGFSTYTGKKRGRKPKGEQVADAITQPTTEASGEQPVVSERSRAQKERWAKRRQAEATMQAPAEQKTAA